MKNGLHILEQNGSPIHYWLDGMEDAPLIVFTHGATVDHRMFDEQISILRDNYRTLSWDVRGHGESQPIGEKFTLLSCADDLIALVDATGYQKAVFVGQSMGGNITQELLIKYPERVKALVLIDCACNTLHLSAWERFLVRLSIPLLRLYPAGMLRNQIAKASSVKPDVQAYIKEAAQIVLSSGHFMDVWVATVDCLHDLPEYKITLPLLLVHGDHDNLGTIGKSMPQWSKRDKAAYYVIPNAGHTANQDNPIYFNQILLKFLEAQMTARYVAPAQNSGVA